MDGVRIDEGHLAGGHRHGIQAGFERSGLNLLLDLGKSCAGFDTHGDGCARLGGQRIPTLGFAARIAVLLRHPVVGMHLHAQLLPRKD